MTRINPLYIILLFLTLFFISFYLVSNQKKLYLEKSLETIQLETKAKEYKDLSNSWKNEKYINKTLDEILKNSIFKNEKIVKTATKESIKIKIETTDSHVLDNFLNRVLNKQLIIKKLELDKNFIILEVGTK
ncbi:hypothetical protein [Arcobacter defluvii]|uniref:Uncharacterized protein n=1 Tax=Arcobacter defluvii TaxID=873191 RepID=A0AAE7E7G1_9BACT|nr:hypothetical protein [Arcobacter defluvii]QKF78427.1 hypothetical protein ADFLV_2439 [Arcobacter defluvii]RXI30789.1 hypothetical protein CP964_11085 [Arcobacter defluvii]